MDDADYVHDEVSVNIRHQIFQFCVSDITDDTVYYIDNCAFCDFYCDNFRL